jgi:hypothetical protein
MIKKLRNQPYAPKSGASSKKWSKLQNGSKEEEKKCMWEQEVRNFTELVFRHSL